MIPPPAAAGTYRTIYADPPWTFGTWSDRGKGRSAEAHYDTLDIEGIAALPVADWAAKDAVLLMWITDPLLPRGLDVIRAWGFIYKTVGFHWTKQNRSGNGFFTGMGFWTRANPELCLLATRGKPKRRSGSVPRLVVAPRREHSRKPEEVRNRIERLCDGPYLEMFGRDSRPGWDAWGEQTRLFDAGSVKTRRRPSREPPPAPLLDGDHGEMSE